MYIGPPFFCIIFLSHLLYLAYADRNQSPHPTSSFPSPSQPTFHYNKPIDPSPRMKKPTHLLPSFLKTSFIPPVLVIIASLFIYSRQLLAIPPGLTIDEASLGTNALLLARTAHDETGRFLPVFTLTIHGSDWKQPSTQYYLALLFKIFSPSVWLLRFSSVMIATAAGFFLYLLISKLINSKIALLGWLLYLTTPLVIIHSHLATENIMPVLFAALWVWSVYYYSQTKSSLALVLTALILGFSFYSYRGMRAITPVWILITACYLILANWHQTLYRTLTSNIKPFAIFVLTLLPFFAIIPLLETKYAGAVFNNQQYARPGSVYQFLYPYLSTFDPGFLFVKGDDLLVHSTHIHGMFLIATLPLFLLGTYQIITRRRLYSWFVFTAFFLTPLMYGWVDSIHRASRLLALVPFYILISAMGIRTLQSFKAPLFRRTLSLLLALLVIGNFVDFVNYYWSTYPHLIQTQFSGLEKYHSYQILAQQSQILNKTPYLAPDILSIDGESGKFYQQLYFSNFLDPAQPATLPSDGILLSQREHIPGLTRINLNLPYYYLHSH